jgi:hypothetical protein
VKFHSSLIHELPSKTEDSSLLPVSSGVPHCRSKMRRMGIVEHVSRFNKPHGYREGWIFPYRFSRILTRLSELTQDFRTRNDDLQERKDRDLFIYL